MHPNPTPSVGFRAANGETLALQRDSYIARAKCRRHTYRQNSAHHRSAGSERRKISEAMNADFGCRPRQVNLMTDVTGSLENLKHAKKHLHKWMKHEKRPSMFPPRLARRPVVYSVPTKGLWV